MSLESVKGTDHSIGTWAQIDKRRNEQAQLKLEDLESSPHICCPLRPALGVVPEPTQPFH